MSIKDKKFEQYLRLSKETLVYRLIDAESELKYHDEHAEDGDDNEELVQLRIECTGLRKALQNAVSKQNRERALKNNYDRYLARKYYNICDYLRNYLFLTKDEIDYVANTGKPQMSDDKDNDK